MLARDPVLLLTGVTGLVGGELLQRLLPARPGRRIVTLTRQPERVAELNSISGVVALQGDVTEQRCGLDRRAYSELQHTVTQIIHCAAVTRFDLPMERARAVNRDGTRNLLELASRCRKLEKFAYVSTLYVVGRSQGRFPEGPLRHQNEFSNTYQQSKYEAEELVSKAMSQLPAAIFRLSSIIGDSRTGVVRQFNYVHQMLRLFARNVLPVAPGEPEAPVDLIATDWALAALAYLFESGFVPGRFYHLCAGPERSVSVREMIDLTVSIFESHPLGRQWLPIRVPELVPLSRYEEFVAERRRDDDKLLNELLRVLGYFVPHLALFQAFDNQGTTEALAPSGLKFPPIRAYYGQVVGYCLETNWGRRLPIARQKSKKILDLPTGR
jgi:nucleoside-diphosphate-sugar epimerase